jgi:uncharacterized glyoxalase superfamily protein PhnB
VVLDRPSQWLRITTPSATGGHALIEGLGFVRLEVSDLERSLAFYHDVLRFEVESLDDEPRQASLRAGDLRLVLIERRGGANERGGGVRLNMEVSGVDAYHDALVARGLSPSLPADSSSTRCFSVSDPDGYSWTFHQSLR